MDKTGKFNAYPAYKDSGVEWLGKIPEKWSLEPLKRRFTVANGSTPKSDEPLYWDGNIRWATPEDLGKVNGKYLTDTKRQISEDGYANCGTQLVPSGSVILSTRAPIGSIAIAGAELCTNQGCRALVPVSNADSDFAYYALSALTGPLQVYGRGTTFLELSASDLGAFSLVFPPITEQRAIATFLDRETAKIDDIINKQERLIELLQEKRTALISHAITKGLDPSVPMKDSGIEWLGEVPAHWEVSYVRRYVVEHRQGFYTNESYVDNGLKLLRITDLFDNGKVSFEQCPKVTYSKDIKPFMLLENDFVFARTGGAGLFGYIDKIDEKAIYASYLIRFRFKKNLFPKFLKYIFLSDNFQKNIKKNIHGGVNQNIHAEDIKNQVIVFPILKEQQTICNFLDHQTAKIDDLIAKARHAITLLKEHRTALISAAVTGKIDARNEQLSKQSYAG